MVAQYSLLRQCWFVLLVSIAVPCAQAQTSIAALSLQVGAASAGNSLPSGSVPADPPATLEDDLHTLFASADVVFAGEVTAIERTSGAVLVRWRVDEAVRGVSSESYTLREWPGLWEGDAARYFVGERALVLLHAPSVAGFASPVGGGDGIVPLRGDGTGSALDLRLLAMRVVGTDAARLRLAAARKDSDARTISQENSLQTTSADDAVADVVDSNSAVDGSLVLGMLHSWQRVRGSR